MIAPGPATASEIVEILGAVDETMLAEILRTEASAAEVLEAFVRIQGDDAVGPVVRRAAGAKVVEVMSILQAAELGPEPE